jgi:hypothetical protein
LRLGRSPPNFFQKIGLGRRQSGFGIIGPFSAGFLGSAQAMAASEGNLHHLPLQTTSLIGRDLELVELQAALTRTRLLTLTGVGGVGKTRLALAISERVAGSFPDGTWFVDLAPLADPVLVPQTLAVAVSAPHP